MTIKPTHVTFEQAKLLKEKGFDIDTGYFYDIDGCVYRPLFNSSDIHAPEQHLVVEWLRVKHGIWVLIDIEDVRHLCNYVIKWHNNICLIETRGKGYKSPQEAYSGAFDNVLNNLI